MTDYDACLAEAAKRREDPVLMAEFRRKQTERRALALAEQEREERASRIAYARKVSVIGARFADRTFANFEPRDGNRDALSAAKQCVGDGLGLAIYGGCGIGKTHLAGAIANAGIEIGRPAFVMTVPGILRLIRTSFDDGAAETESQIIDRLARVPVLVLDDLGKERLTEWAAVTLWDLANARYERNLPVIVTTNLAGMTGVAARYSDRVPGVDPDLLPAFVDRLFEMVGGRWVEIKDSTHRWSA